MVVACLALFVASTGTSVAARHYLITSTKQIKPSVRKALKGAKGPRGQSVTGLTGPRGPAGATGAQGLAGAAGGAQGPQGQQGPAGAAGAKGATGAAGAQGPAGAAGAKGATGAAGAQGASGIVTTVAFYGNVFTILGSTDAYVFAGGTSQVTTTASQRLTGAAEAPLGSTASTGGQNIYYGLCYQSSTQTGALYNFAGPDYSIGTVYPDRRTFAAAASVVPGAGTWNVGFCVSNPNTNPINDNDYANGWVLVTN